MKNRKRFNRSALKKIVLLLASALVLTAVFPFVWWFAVQQYYGRQIYDVASVPEAQVAIVFGAGLNRRGGLSDVLRDRMDVAIALYEAGKADKLLLSGDNSFADYNEPGAMRDYALQQGVADEDIQPDFGGRRTYDTCYRARHIFQVQDAILVTQQYHLPRALLNCDQLGIDAVGVATDLQSYRAIRWFTLREIPATLQSGWDLLQKEPSPVMGEPIPLVN